MAKHGAVLGFIEAMVSRFSHIADVDFPEHIPAKTQNKESAMEQEPLRSQLIGTTIKFHDRENVVEGLVKHISITGMMTVMDSQGFIHLVNTAPSHLAKECAFAAIVPLSHKKKSGYKQ